MDEMQVNINKSLSQVDKLKNLTFGFIRELINENNCNIYIPKTIKLLITLFVPNLFIDSSILTIKEKDELLSMINTHKITCNKFKNCEWKLLLRASKDGYSTKTFHNLCDNKPNTVCFVETTK